METAIRWSQTSTDDSQRFLYVDVVGKAFKLSRIRGISDGIVEYETVSNHTKVPSFRAFDWSPSNEALVAVGQSSGEATVLRIDDGSQDHLSFQIRNQRLCNAVAFSTQNLLAAGLDKVRNDVCLNIWDLQQRLPSPNTRGFGSNKSNPDPLHKLASSEPITSIKFFQDNPQLLVAGVKGQFVRLYDLREPSAGGVLQFSTRCVHNLAIDYCDENYIASCLPISDPTVCIWDRRMGARSNSASGGYSFVALNETAILESSLDLKHAIDKPGSIWSLRFSRTTRGCLGILSSTGHLKTCTIGREFSLEVEQNQHAPNQSPKEAKSPENIYIDQVHDISRSFNHPAERINEKARIVSFDFTTNQSLRGTSQILSLAGDGTIKVIALPSTPEPLGLSSLGYLSAGRVEHEQAVPVSVADGKGALKVGDALDQIRRKAEPRNRMKQAAKQSKHIKAEDPLRRASSRRNHEWNADLGYFEANVSLAELLTLTSTQRLRCEAGYLFSAARNKSIVSDSHWIQSFWAWIDRASRGARSGNMVQDNFDLSYLGVHAIWMDDLGPTPHTTRAVGPNPPKVSNVIEKLAQRLDIPAAKGCPTAYSDHRRLCLHISGLALTYEELQANVNRLVEKKQHTRAAAIAIFADERKLAYRALRAKSSTQSHKMLAIAIAGAAKRGLLPSAEDIEAENDWSETISALSEELTDPHARAILALVRTGNYEAIVEEESLPLKDRVGVALRWLSDRALTTYIANATKDAVAAGDIEGVILTGTGSTAAVDLLGNYIRKFGDLQTAVLALSATVPRYVNDARVVRRFSNWRETYRHQLNSWGLKYDRVRFDIGYQKLSTDQSGRRLIDVAKPQVALVCSYCSQGLAQFDDQEDGEDNETIKTHKTQKNVLTGDKAAAIGTVCPKCGRHLPRCGVCDMWLGTPDTSHMRWYKGGSVDLSASLAGSVNTTLGPNSGPRPSSIIASKSTANGDRSAEPIKDPQNASEEKHGWEEMLQKFTVICIKCNHGFHANHARQWFGGYAGREGQRVCPVSTCSCVCDT